jgi:CysZ protein
MHPASPIPQLPPKAGWGDLFTGFKLPFRSLSLISDSNRLRSLTAATSAITFVALIAVVWAVFTFSDDLIARFWSRPDAWYAAAFWHLVVVLTALVGVVVGANVLPVLLTAPLQDPISEATEELCGDFQAPAFSLGGLVSGAATGLVHTLKRVAILLAGHAVLFLLHFLPGLGSVVWTFASAAWTIWWIAGEYVGAPMARRLYPFAAVRRALVTRKRLAVGFGLAVYFILWVPILNLFFIPLAVVGGTLLYRALMQAGHIPPPPRERELPSGGSTPAWSAKPP